MFDFQNWEYDSLYNIITKTEICNYDFNYCNTHVCEFLSFKMLGNKVTKLKGDILISTQLIVDKNK